MKRKVIKRTTAVVVKKRQNKAIVSKENGLLSALLLDKADEQLLQAQESGIVGEYANKLAYALTKKDDKGNEKIIGYDCSIIGYFELAREMENKDRKNFRFRF